MLNNHTVFEQFLATLMTIDNDNNLENRNEIISEKVEGDNNIIQQKQDGQWISIKVREEESIKALKLEDEKGYINKNVDDDSNDQGQVKGDRGQKRVLVTPEKIQLEEPYTCNNSFYAETKCKYQEILMTFQIIVFIKLNIDIHVGNIHDF